MTVLAFFEDLGIALSDVLVSVDVSESSLPAPMPIAIPSTFNSLNSILPIVPTSLKRKIIRISSHNGVGDFLVSGTLSHITKLANNAKLLRAGLLTLSLEHSRKLNLSSVQSIVHTASVITEEAGYYDFEIIGVCEGKRYSRQFDTKIAGQIPYFGSVTLSGGGAIALRDWLIERGRQFERMRLGSESQIPKAFRTANWLPAMLLEEDGMAKRSTLSKGVGGYYETFYLSSSRLSPVDSVLTTFISIQGKPRKQTLRFENIFFHKYVDDWLCVLSLQDSQIEFELGNSIRIPLSRFNIFKIPALHGLNSEPNISASSLVIAMGNALLFRLSLFRGKNDVGLYQAKRFYSSEHKILQTKISNGYVHVEINNDLMRSYLQNFPTRPSRNEEVVRSGR